MRRKVFYRWLLVLGLVWLLASVPGPSGPGGFFFNVGFPFVYTSWWGGRYTGFDATAFTLDLLIGIAFVVGLPLLCAWSRAATDPPSSTQS
jgi:hypothetical protein